jgi:hypothetical protein
MPSSQVSGSSMPDMRTPQMPAGMAGLELDDHAAGEEEVEAWLDEYAATRNPVLRDRIVMAYPGDRGAAGIPVPRAPADRS